MQKAFNTNTTSVESAAALTSSSATAENSTSSISSREQNEERPKVVVPNIEEELGFLADAVPVKPIVDQRLPQQQPPAQASKMPEKKPLSLPAASATNGFMASYIKFLQGERDPSPPPRTKGNRKTPYTRIKNCKSGAAPKVKPTISTELQSKLAKPLNPSPVVDLEDDPRYFPLPKTSANRGSFNSSDDDSDSFGKDQKKEDAVETPKTDLNSTKPSGTDSNKNGDANSKTTKSSVVGKQLLIKTPVEAESIETSAVPEDKAAVKLTATENKQMDTFGKLKEENQNTILTNNSGNKKKKTPVSRKKSSSTKENEIRDDVPDNVVPARRESSTRKAKERSSIQKFVDDDLDDPDDPNSINSDSDPAWSPAAAKDDSDEDFENRKRTRNRLARNSSMRARKRTRRSMTESSSDEDEERRAAKQKKYSPRTKVTPAKTGLQANNGNSPTTAVSTDPKTADQKDDAAQGFPFTIGEFVVSKSDLIEENPCIWRVDGKSLLQKYEPFEQNGEMVYKNIPTYSGWTTKNRDSFQVVPIRIRMQNRSETIVELLRSEMKISAEDQKAVDKVMEDNLKYQENFEIYIQTLISQALDSNFLAEIIQENDEYFLLNVKTIDDITEERKKRVMALVNWQDSIVERSIATWPCFNVLAGVSKEDMDSKKCASCCIHSVTNRVIVYGQPYNSANLEGIPPDPSVVGNKDFLLCKNCISVVTLYNKIAHQKYLMYIECAKRVQEKRTSDPSKDTTVILNELLADEPWLTHLFKNVRLTWGQVERLHRSNDNKDV